jgi:hypothetical protein
MKGIKWGADINDLPDMVLVGDVGAGKRVYRREGERLKIGDAAIEAVMYGFYRDRLEDVQIHFRSSANFAKLEKILFQACGTGRRADPSVQNYHWNGKKFSMFLTFDERAEKGALICTFMPIYKERQEMKQNHDKYKGMVEKFKTVKKYAFQSMR